MNVAGENAEDGVLRAAHEELQRPFLSLDFVVTERRRISERRLANEGPEMKRARRIDEVQGVRRVKVAAPIHFVFRVRRDEWREDGQRVEDDQDAAADDRDR